MDDKAIDSRVQLGELLLRLGWVGGVDLARALELQQRQGGRLGSNLVRLGALSPDQVAHALGMQHDVLPATEVLLEGATSAALGALPSELCAELGVLPLRLEPGRLHLGLLDAQRLDLVDRVARQTGVATVVPYALPEICFERYFARYYRIPLARPPRGGAFRPDSPEELTPGTVVVVDRPPRDQDADPLLTRLLEGATAPAARPGDPQAPAPGAASSFEIVVVLEDGARGAPAKEAAARPAPAPTPPPRPARRRSRFAAKTFTLLRPDERAFGRYNMICRLGAGGMATLFLAELAGPAGFQKLAVIKQIHEHLGNDQEFVRLLIDEGRLAARIAHPNVVQMLELGCFQTAYFLAMEYVAGENLMALLRRTPVPLTLAARIVACAAAGLHAAHELRDATGQPLSVVHRDVSPENILLSYDGAVKVLDFGIARARGSLHSSQARVVRGKSCYLAPEQIACEPVDRRVDVFSLGIVLYELTTRTRLFRGATDAESLGRVLAAPVRPPSELAGDYPAELERVVMQALERDRKRRFQTAGQMQRALEAYIAGTGTPVLDGELAALMAEAFADRIEKKRAVLREYEESF